MNKTELKNRILQNIDQDKSVKFLRALVRLPSENGQPTLAQELILQKLEELNFSIDKFSGNVKGVENYPDYCPLEQHEKVDERAYNIAGVKKGKSNGKSLMLFAHVDTEEYGGDRISEVYEGKIENGRLYGHGVADDKCGLATIILAVEAVLKEIELDGDLTVMSVLGKRGGSAGTLSAIARGYKADGGIYLHPAETGHGYHEVKNYSMGTVDFSVKVKGLKGPDNDELDGGEINAVKKGAKVVEAMDKWDEQRRKAIVFKEETYKGMPKTKLNISTVQSGTKVGKDPIIFEIKSRLYFDEQETIESVLGDLERYFIKVFEKDEWLSGNTPEIEILNLRATPALVERNACIVKSVEENITFVTKEKDFIHQYHGASDIRHPIVYGNTPTVGIGPMCGGIYGSDWTEWVEIKDYVDGIKILSSLIVDWCLN